MSGLEAHVRVADRGVDARIAVGPGQTLVVLGPNGSGKSTALEAIAGIVPGAAVSLDGTVLDRVGPRGRGIGLLSQDSALFPGMSVRDNVAFGPRSRGVGRGDAGAIAAEWLARVGLDGLGDRRPAQLSGGQARRVAIARALAAKPRLLLLDEPFAGLDVTAASSIRTLLIDLLAGVTAVLATHDVLDAHALGDHVTVMDSGRVAEHGPVSEVLARPRTAFAARMAARVLVTGVMDGADLVVEDGSRVPVTDGPGQGTRAAIAVHPAAIAVAEDRPAAEPGLTWIADTVTALEPRGDEVRVHGAILAADVDAAAAARLTPGSPVSFGVPHGAVAYALEP